jgi:DNA-binding NarL/FixJ family response regulator
VIRLVIADDHPAVRLSYAAYLGELAEFDVVGTVTNGSEAVAACRTNEPDVVVMDVRMPVMDGIEATRLIKKNQPGTKVILVSAYEQEELIEAGRRAGADLFIVKGMSGAQLATHVKGVAA